MGRCRPICRLRNNLGCDSRGVLAGDLILKRRRDEDVALQFEDMSRAWEIDRPGEIEKRTIIVSVPKNVVRIQPFRIADGAANVRQSDNHRPAFTQKLGGMVSDLAKTLNRHAFSLQTRLKPKRPHIVREIARFADAKVHASAGRPLPSANPALLDRFSGHTR